MELSWPPGSLLFDDGAVAFYTKFGIGKETIILGDSVRLRALEPFCLARIVALFQSTEDDTRFAQVKYFYYDDNDPQLVHHTDKMETVSLIAVVEKVHVVTTFQFENQLYSGDIPTEQLFYCSGLKYDVDSHTLTDPEAEEPEPIPTEPIKLIPGLRVVTSDMIFAGVLQQQQQLSDQDSVTSPESPLSNLSSASPAPVSPGYYGEMMTTYTPPPPVVEVKRKRGRPRKHHRNVPAQQQARPTAAGYYQPYPQQAGGYYPQSYQQPRVHHTPQQQQPQQLQHGYYPQQTPSASAYYTAESAYISVDTFYEGQPSRLLL